MNNFFPNLNSTTLAKGVPVRIQPRPGESNTMKNMSPLLLAGLMAGWFATTAPATAQDAPPAPPPAAEQTAPPANRDTNTPAASPANAAPAVPEPRNSNADLTSGTADQGLRLNMKGVTIDQALGVLSESAGFTIIRQASTTGPRTVDLVSDKPLNKEEIVALFNKVLANNGLTAIQDKNTLTIMTTEDARYNAGVPILVYTPGNDIPADSQIVTEIIPVHSLNPTQVIKDLYTLIPQGPQGAQMNTSESGNAVIMTARQSDVRRFVSLIKALDSTGNGALEVFLLQFADSKSIASELKDVFTADSANANNPFAAMMGGRGGRGGMGGMGGMGGGGTTGAENATRAAVHVNAVSDDQNNAVLVSAPADYMEGISNIIFKLDIPQEDSVVIRLFVLTNADCTDVATELTQLFPDPNSQANSSRGGRGNPMMFMGPGNTGSTSMSDRQKKQVTVNAVADARTQSVLVTASKDTMASIEQIINEMDANPSGHVKVYVYHIQNADAMDLVGPLGDLFPRPTGMAASSTSSLQNPLQQRANNAATSATSTASSSITGSSSSSSGGGGGGGGR
jgi:type II secretory pathway component GspD/PulD (secretin)